MGASVSVVIPVYNRSFLIRDAIESALAQLRPNDEIVVVDDGSTDDTVSVVRRYGDSVKLIEQPNGGAGAARNRGVAEATKPLVAFLDSDDQWLPGKLDIERQVMDDNPDVVMCFAEYAMEKGGSYTPVRLEWDPGTLGPRGEVTVASERIRTHVGDGYLAFLWLGPQISINTVLMRREVIPTDPFAVDLSVFEEEQAFAKIARFGRVAYLDREVAVGRSHEGPRITDVMNTVEPDTAWLTVIERVWGQDEEFLALHQDTYNKALEHWLLMRARGLLVLGETKLAKQDIRRAGEFNRMARIVSMLPAWGLKTVVRTRDALRGLTG